MASEGHPFGWSRPESLVWEHWLFAHDRKSEEDNGRASRDRRRFHEAHMDIDTSVLEQFRSEGKALAAAISKHLDAHPEYSRLLKGNLHYLWGEVDYAVNAMGCRRCEHERIGVVDMGLDGFLCAECAEKDVA